MANIDILSVGRAVTDIAQSTNDPPPSIDEKQQQFLDHLKLRFPSIYSGFVRRTRGPDVYNLTFPEPRFAGAQPYDAGGLGGGVLTPGAYVASSGQLQGELIRKKRVRIGQLVTGGVSAVLPRLIQSLVGGT